MAKEIVSKPQGLIFWSNGKFLKINDLMQKRIDSIDLMDFQLYSADWVAMNPEGNVKLILNHNVLTACNFVGENAFEVYSSSQAQYAGLSGIEFDQKSVERFANGNPLTRTEARNNLFWKHLARNDSPLLTKYTTLLFDQADRRFNEKNGMSLDFINRSGQFVLKPIYLKTLADSGAYGHEDHFGHRFPRDLRIVK